MADFEVRNFKIRKDGNVYKIGTAVTNVVSEYNPADESVTLKTGGAVANNSILDMIYPIGSVYISIGDIKPAFGQWERLATGTTLWNDANADGRTIKAGLPNLKAQMNRVLGWYGGTLASTNGFLQVTGNRDGGFTNTNTGSERNWTFDASKANSVYRDDCNTVQPPAIAVSMWQRIA